MISGNALAGSMPIEIRMLLKLSYRILKLLKNKKTEDFTLRSFTKCTRRDSNPEPSDP